MCLNISVVYAFVQEIRRCALYIITDTIKGLIVNLSVFRADLAGQLAHLDAAAAATEARRAEAVLRVHLGDDGCAHGWPRTFCALT